MPVPVSIAIERGCAVSLPAPAEQGPGRAALRSWPLPSRSLWAPCPGGGFARFSIVQPKVMPSPAVAGGAFVLVLAQGGQPPFRAGWRGVRARAFRFSFGLSRASGVSWSFVWLVWQGSCRLPPRSRLLAWLRGQSPAGQFWA